MDKVEDMRSEIKDIIKDKTFNYVLDEDSHALDDIASKCCWIKAEKLQFSILNNVFKDFQNSITYSLPESNRSFIKSVYIGSDDFFKGKDKAQNGMIVNFSESMNSFVGGRGTGKSTVLNIIEFLISQTVTEKKTLKHILKQGNICLLYSHEGQDYYVMFNSGSGDFNDVLFVNQCFENKQNGYEVRYGRTGRRIVYKNYAEDPEKRRRKETIQKRIQVYDSRGVEIKSSSTILNDIFTRKFSINNLVNIAGSSEETRDFILDIMSKYPEMRIGIRFGKPTTWTWIEKTYKKLEEKIKIKKDNVNKIIDEFNNEQEKKIRIVYSQKQIKEFYFPWKEVLRINSTNERSIYDDYQISNNGILDFFGYLENKTNALDVVIKLKKGDYGGLRKSFDEKFNIESYLIPDSIRTADKQLKKISNDNMDDFLASFKYKIVNADKIIINFLKNYLENFDSFALEFNINNHEDSKKNSKLLFKPIDEISMGQKVVAMLSFLLGYSEFIDDKSPLIIDQPEDNLDNRYIYRNLVQDFVKVKKTRQVIIATHNSTVVVNTGCENVIIMDSDDSKSWIEKSGYSQNPNITREIINKLEGGEEALKQKIRIYSDYL